MSTGGSDGGEAGEIYRQAIAAHRQNDLNRAEGLYQAYLRLVPRDAKALSLLGIVCFDLRNFEAAAKFLAASVAINPDDGPAHSNLGCSLHELRRLDEAVASFSEALRINANDVSARFNLALALIKMSRFDEALSQLDAAVGFAPQDAEIHYNRGMVLMRRGRIEESLKSLDHAIALSPALPFARSSRLHARMHLADWRHFDAELKEILAGIERGEPVIDPFMLLALSPSRALQLKAAKSWASNVSRGGVPAFGKREPGNKFRVAYFSMDFGEHPVSYLGVELFELHDRSRFDVVGVSLRQNRASRFTDRVIGSFDQFVDVSRLSNADAVQACRNLQIDIAIDLAGYTASNRVALFAQRVAPVQAGYLGYLGTLGADFLDYLIADDVLIPQEHLDGYAEKVVKLPSYQASDRKRVVSAKPMSRAQHGLPEGAFVFCCFNQTYKILPETYDAWMHILKEVPESVLWLLRPQEQVATNLLREAASRGVDPNRLVFAPRVPNDEYLARYRLADLFLDTSPYNAGTTANDALWMGVPVITQLGESFSGRMAASLLAAAGLPELITRSAAQYGALAIALAKDRAGTEQIKRRLVSQRDQLPLFDMPRFTRSMENAFVKMVERSRMGLPPDHISVDR